MVPIAVRIAEDRLVVEMAFTAHCRPNPVTGFGAAEDYDSTVELVEKHHPSVLLTDVRMPPTSTDEGIRLAQWIRTAHPDTGVIVLSQYAEPSYAAGLLDGGTTGRGYLLKERVSHFDHSARRCIKSRPVGRCSIRWWWRRCWLSRAPRRR